MHVFCTPWAKRGPFDDSHAHLNEPLVLRIHVIYCEGKSNILILIVLFCPVIEDRQAGFFH